MAAPVAAPAPVPRASSAVVSAARPAAPDAAAPKRRLGWLLAVPVVAAIAAGAYFLGRTSAPAAGTSGATVAQAQPPVAQPAKALPATAPAPPVEVAKQEVPAQPPPSATQPQPAAQKAPAPASEQPKPAVAQSQPASPQAQPAVAKVPAQEAEAPTASEFDTLMAKARAANGRKAFRTAAAHFREALGLQPDSLEAKAGLGIALVNGEGSYTDAARLLSEVVKVNDRDERAWLALGMAYQFNGDQDSAFKAYRKYLEIAPNGESAQDVRMLLQQPSN